MTLPENAYWRKLARMISPPQSRAARALLNWSQPQLATASRVSVSTIRDFETGKRAPIDNNLAAIRAALESAGVIFVEENGEGPGVRLRKSPRQAAAIAPGMKVKYREGVATPGVRNMGMIGEVLDRGAGLGSEVVVRWPSGEEAEATASKLEIVDGYSQSDASLDRQIAEQETAIAEMPEHSKPSPEAGMAAMDKAMAQNDLIGMKNKRTRRERAKLK